MRFGRYIPAKLDELLGDIKFAKTYIQNIIILIKDCFTNHIEQLGIIFGGLRTAGLKDNALKYNFGLKETPYLGYVITREDIKPNQKKVQRIMDLGRPTATTEARLIIVMVQ